jgi:hypothetical protein
MVPIGLEAQRMDLLSSWYGLPDASLRRVLSWNYRVRGKKPRNTVQGSGTVLMQAFLFALPSLFDQPTTNDQSFLFSQPYATHPRLYLDSHLALTSPNSPSRHVRPYGKIDLVFVLLLPFDRQLHPLRLRLILVLLFGTLSFDQQGRRCLSSEPVQAGLSVLPEEVRINFLFLLLARIPTES